MSVVFVFGSNLAGIHGAGAAKYAVVHHGAIYGQGIGRQGDSYGIPTKDHNIQTLPLSEINKYIAQFVEYAVQNPGDTFHLTPIGCGLAGYTRPQIFGLIKQYTIPRNVVFTKEWFDL
jgi:hypothetical protein